MRTIKKLGIESLERREVFTVAPGLEGLAISGDCDTSPPPIEPVDFVVDSDARMSQSDAFWGHMWDLTNRGAVGEASGDPRAADAVFRLTMEYEKSTIK